MFGPKKSFYEGGLFYSKVIFPDDYPNSRPKILFLTPIYHPNVNYLASVSKPLGHICVSSLYAWNPED